MKRKIVIVIGIIIIALLMVFVVSKYPKTTTTIQTKEFDGNLRSIKDSSIFIQGSPYSSDLKVVQGINIDKENPPIVEIVITPNTKITRTTFRMPTDEELKKTNGMFYPDKLPKEQSDVTLDALAKDYKATHYIIGVKVIATSNVIGQQKFTAKQIEYIFPTFPTPTP